MTTNGCLLHAHFNIKNLQCCSTPNRRDAKSKYQTLKNKKKYNAYPTTKPRIFVCIHSFLASNHMVLLLLS